MATILAEEATVVVNAEMPAPVPTEMARSVDMEALAGEIAKCVGTWKTDHSVAVPGMPCCSITAKYVFDPLKDGVYPYEGVTKVKCCGCCPMMTEKQTGLVSGDCLSFTATTASGDQHALTLQDMDASKKLTYKGTGPSKQGPVDTTTVIEAGADRWTDTVTVGGHTMVFVFSKTT